MIMKTQILAPLFFCLLACAPVSRAADDLATFFVGRLKFSNNEGNDCGDVGKDLIALVSRASTIQVREQKPVKIADAALYETPFVFMNGHNDFVLSDAELESLRVYLAHGGFVLGSGCCTNPAFPAAWRREFSRIFPGEKVKPIPYDHLIYRAFYKIQSLHSLGNSKEVHIEGLFYHDNLVGVLVEEGLCCSFAMDNNCNKGSGLSPEDGKKVALNIAVYALTH